jgi:hypothetical protein
MRKWKWFSGRRLFLALALPALCYLPVLIFFMATMGMEPPIGPLSSGAQLRRKVLRAIFDVLFWPAAFNFVTLYVYWVVVVYLLLTWVRNFLMS